VVINGGMNVVVADGATAGAVLVAGAMMGRVAAMDAVATAVAESSQFLELDETPIGP
jgi:hypothetical protein